MEDQPTAETLNLTRVKYTEAVNYLNRIAGSKPEFLYSEGYSIDNLDRDELRDLANELKITPFELAGGFEVTIKTDNYTLTLWGK